MSKFNFPIDKCPKCGNTSFTVKQRISGIGEYYVDLESGDVDGTELHSGLRYTNINKYAICADCGKRLFKIDNNLNVIE